MNMLFHQDECKVWKINVWCVLFISVGVECSSAHRAYDKDKYADCQSFVEVFRARANHAGFIDDLGVWSTCCAGGRGFVPTHFAY